VTPQPRDGALVFRAYGDDFLQVGDERIAHGLLIHQGRLETPWGPDTLPDLAPEHLQAVARNAPEVLIIGTGRVTAFPAPAMTEWLELNHIAFECMDSRSAARTYNILIAEGRDASVAMLPPGA